MDQGPACHACTSSPKTTSTLVAASPTTSGLGLPSPEICVICLELLIVQTASSTGTSSSTHGPEVSDLGKSNDSNQVATTLPCQHAQFHLSCLGTWLSHSTTCPLCKTTVQSIEVNREGQRPKVISLPRATESTQWQTAARTNVRRSQPRRRPIDKDAVLEDPVLAFRRQLYLRQVPSLYLGRGISRDPNQHRIKRPIRPPITPASFSSATNPNAANLLHLVTIWIRRELQLFPFLQSSGPTISRHTTTTAPAAVVGFFPTPYRRTTSHYLLPFILSVLQQIDLHGAANQAVELLSEYLGKIVATLFCHELHTFLSSGAESVPDWDAKVQYWFEEEGELRDGLGMVLGKISPVDRDGT